MRRPTYKYEKNMNTCIINWNTNGFFNKIDEIKILINNLNPYLISIQETRLKPNQNVTLKYYNIFRNDVLTEQGQWARGRVAIFVKDDVKCREIDINTELQIVVVQIVFPHKITICNVYLSPDETIREDEINNIINQLPRPFIIMGDFNAHNSNWDNEHNGADSRGRKIENIIQHQGLVCMNSGTPTHFNYSSGKKSAIDLVLATPNISVLYEWSVYNDLCRSDHYPIICKPLIHNQSPQNMTKIKKWLINKANWEKYQEIEFDDDIHCRDIEEKTTYITQTIKNAALNSIPQSSDTIRRHNVPWWTPTIQKCITERRRAERRAYRRPFGENLMNLRKAMAISRKRIKEGKTTEFQNFVKTISFDTTPDQMWRKIKSIKGVATYKEIKILDVNDIITSNKTEIADSLATFFEFTTSSEIYSDDFVAIKIQREAQTFNVRRISTAQYPFSMFN